MLELSKAFLKKDISDFKKTEVRKFQELMKYHSDLYYNKQDPIISDFEYDELFKKLSLLESRFNIISRQSKEVGADIKESTFLKVAHSRPMISLDNTYNEEELQDFDGRVKKLSDLGSDIQYTLEFKFDGLWVELIYKKWELIQAITRWNGIEGEDVTENIRQIENIPKQIPYKEHLEVRGEVVMPISVFEHLNKEAKKTWWKIFSNPRNAASWSVRLLDNSVTKERKLKFFAYDLANFDDFRNKQQREQYFDVIKDLEKLGFEISSFFTLSSDIHWIIEKIDNFSTLVWKLDFEIDWLVVKVNNIDLWSEIGSTEHHPRYAIAYKFPAEIVTTQILSVEHSVWRTGTITPVANLEPVNISWAMIARATLHNYEEVESLDVRLWDTVFIKRAWEVIPKIISVVKEGRVKWAQEILPPELCPSCSTSVIKYDEKVRFYCPNTRSCPAQISEQLAFAVGKQGFNIDGFWERQVEIFLNEWIIEDLVGVFKIDERAEDILELEWFKEKSVNNLIEAVESAKNVKINELLTSLWISWVGKKTAKTLSKLFIWESDILDFKYSLEDLEALDDVGPEIAYNVIEYFNDDTNKDLLWRLIKVLKVEFAQAQVIPEWERWEFFGKKVCITGSFENYKRDDLVKILEENGWEFMSSVTKKTDFLLAWEKAGSKLAKANDLWVRVLNVDEFLERVKG